MSRQNKVNPGQYTQAGRLAPDDAARERGKQSVDVASQRGGSGQKATGVGNRESAAEEQNERERLAAGNDAPRSGDAMATGGDAPAADRENEQTSSKQGSRSGAQKAAASKYVNRPHPASKKIAGASGRMATET